MELLLPAAAAALVIFFVGYLRRSQEKITCPQCHSSQLRQVEQQLKEIRQDGGKIGYATKLDVQLIMETSYRCQNCSHTWTVTAPES